MAASRRSPNLSGKPNLSWVGLGPRVGEDPSSMGDSRGTQMGRATEGERYFMVRAVTGDDWHAVLVKGDEAVRQIIEANRHGHLGRRVLVLREPLSLGHRQPQATGQAPPD